MISRTNVDLKEVNKTIETKDLVEFIRNLPLKFSYEHMEHWTEIIVRLRAFDKLKESIEKLCRRLSNEVDK